MQPMDFIKDMKITITFNPATSSLAVVENDFTHIEAMGVLQAAIASISEYWLKNCEMVELEEVEYDEEDN